MVWRANGHRISTLLCRAPGASVSVTVRKSSTFPPTSVAIVRASANRVLTFPRAAMPIVSAVANVIARADAHPVPLFHGRPCQPGRQPQITPKLTRGGKIGLEKNAKYFFRLLRARCQSKTGCSIISRLELWIAKRTPDSGSAECQHHFCRRKKNLFIQKGFRGGGWGGEFTLFPLVFSAALEDGGLPLAPNPPSLPRTFKRRTNLGLARSR